MKPWGSLWVLLPGGCSKSFEGSFDIGTASHIMSSVSPVFNRERTSGSPIAPGWAHVLAFEGLWELSGADNSPYIWLLWNGPWSFDIQLKDGVTAAAEFCLLVRVSFNYAVLACAGDSGGCYWSSLTSLLHFCSNKCKLWQSLKVLGPLNTQFQTGPSSPFIAILLLTAHSGERWWRDTIYWW